MDIILSSVRQIVLPWGFLPLSPRAFSFVGARTRTIASTRSSLFGAKRGAQRGPRQLDFCSRAAPGKKQWGVPDWGKPMFDSPLLAYAVLIVSLTSLVYSLKDE